ncbi:hypothetical protein TNIN_208851 [Trichonephila inaurata madagascariensis]|uniref:Uncharacterized protein n=1 Tax=Trichonephila inaurata madagascariensis TaxID=2747483 RepID=A0A8X6IL55_9ARAC|nr:hypothetical protein TNIN_208851 [Trichonephila inaurata madagascariensis]
MLNSKEFQILPASFLPHSNYKGKYSASPSAYFTSFELRNASLALIKTEMPRRRRFGKFPSMKKVLNIASIRPFFSPPRNSPNYLINDLSAQIFNAVDEMKMTSLVGVLECLRIVHINLKMARIVDYDFVILSSVMNTFCVFQNTPLNILDI